VTSERGATFILIFRSPKGHLPWVRLLSIPKKWGFPIEVTVIGHLVCYANLLHLSWALGKFRLCDNKHLPQHQICYLMEQDLLFSVNQAGVVNGASHRSYGDGWCDVGLCLLVCPSVLHVCILRALRHYLLSYP
jgi:hypothetical protein